MHATFYKSRTLDFHAPFAKSDENLNKGGFDSLEDSVSSESCLAALTVIRKPSGVSRSLTDQGCRIFPLC